MKMVVDPYVLSVPKDEVLDKDSVIEFLIRLRSWDSEFIGNSQQYAISGFSLAKMYELGISPTADNLSSLLKKYDITEYSVQDLCPTSDGLIANAQRLEDMIFDAIPEVEQIEGSHIVIPEELRQRLHPEVAKEFIISLTYFAYILQYKQNNIHGSGWSIVTAPFSAGEDVQMLKMHAEISTLNDVGIIESRSIAKDWPLLFDPEHIFAMKDMKTAFNNGDLIQALEIVRCKLKQREINLSIKKIDYKKIRFRKEFRESLVDARMRKRTTYDKDVEKVFEAIVYSIENIWVYAADKHHPLRKEIQNRKSPQRLRKRKDIYGVLFTDDAVRIEAVAGATPLHIHYWISKDGTYEFSNVTDRHDDNTIYVESDQKLLN